MTEQPAPPTVGPPAPVDPPQSPQDLPAARFVYAIGRVEPRFVDVAAEREYAQVVARYDTAGATERQTMQRVLAERENRYLARQVCWVFTVERLPTYVLVPRDPMDLELLVDALRPANHMTDLDVVVGLRGPLAPPEMCGGMVLPIVAFDQLYSFGRDDLISAIPMPDDLDDSDQERFRNSAEELLDLIMQMADNAGSTDEHRALNYLAVRYPAVYAAAAEAHRTEKNLSGVEVRPSRLAGAQSIVNVVFTFTHRRTDVRDSLFVRVNVSGEFPFLTSKLQPFYER